MLTPEDVTNKNQELHERRRQSKRGKVKRVLSYAALLLLGTMILMMTAYYSYYSRLPVGLGSVKVDAVTPESDNRTVNILLYGVDLGLEGAPRADTIILFNINREDGSVHAMSIPRDTRVPIPGRGRPTRINAAHAFGGPTLLKETVEQLLGLDIDYYVGLDFDGFERIIDTLGGVVVDVETRMRYVDTAQDLVIDLHPGVQRLSGNQALQYARYRSDGLGDISIVGNGDDPYGGRVSRQLNLVRAMLKQVLSAQSLLNVPRILSDLSAAVETNIPPDVAVHLAVELRGVETHAIQTVILPGMSDVIDGASYWIPDMARTTELVHKIVLREDMVRVSVLNGNGISGAAGNVADRLRENGYEIVSIANADRFDYAETQVLTKGDQLEAARQIASQLGITVRATINENVANQYGAAVVVIVGRDIQQ